MTPGQGTRNGRLEGVRAGQGGRQGFKSSIPLLGFLSGPSYCPDEHRWWAETFPGMSFGCVASSRQHMSLQTSFFGLSPCVSGSHGSPDFSTATVCRTVRIPVKCESTSVDKAREAADSGGAKRIRKSTETSRNRIDKWGTVGPSDQLEAAAPSSAASGGGVSEGADRSARSSSGGASDRNTRFYADRAPQPWRRDSAGKGRVDDLERDDDKLEEILDGDSLSTPSRGEVFLRNAMERQRLQAQRSTTPAFPYVQGPKEDNRKRDKTKILKASEASCYGCGAGLQYKDPETPGYVAPEVFEVKQRHHQLKDVLCGRCRLLSQGQMIPAVGGHGGYGKGKGFVSAEELRSQLTHLRNSKALIVKLVDIVDFNGSLLTRVRDLVGANPIILVATKVDLLPKGTDLGVVGDWIVESVLRKKLNVVSVHLTSSKSSTGISGVAANIQRQRQGRDVYVLGSANVGKSAFISALLKEMGSRDPAALAAMRRKPIQSAMPGTTLGPIEIKAFSGGGSLHDTPGVHLHHRMTVAVHPDDLPHIAPRRRLRGSAVLAPSLAPREKSADSDQETEADSSDADTQFEKREVQFDGAGTLTGTTLFWGGLARIDVLQAPAGARLRFYGPTGLRVIMVSTAEADDFYNEEVGKILCPPTGEDKLSSWAGLPNQHSVSLTLESGLRPAGDVAISGLGWITVEYPNTEAFTAVTQEDRLRLQGTVDMVVHVPKAVEIYSRPSMPVGVHGPLWYKYADVSDDELESRPRFFY